MPPSTCAAAAKQGGSPRRGADPGAPSLTRHSPAPNGAASPAETREPMFHVKHSLAATLPATSAPSHGRDAGTAAPPAPSRSPRPPPALPHATGGRRLAVGR